ncbi:hypothetical protein ACN42_g4390 [Penicillium freii]|uniref:Uncharacterized protein n=1 Tax=Penicillium freii TaxID=48697 RepID=A0A101MLF6_PENFR|nr:hypothetical protein ACN42_g4390 [Penicillium freii]
MQASLNSSLNASTGDSPHRLMFGVDLRMPWNLDVTLSVGIPYLSFPSHFPPNPYSYIIIYTGGGRPPSLPIPPVTGPAAQSGPLDPN